MSFVKRIKVICEKEQNFSLYTDESGEYWGNSGAGGLFYCPKTKRFLIAKRSKFVNEPNTWGTWGGAIDKNEKPEEALKREIIEETKYKGKFSLKHIWTYQDKKFKFYNYLIIVPEEFEPKHSWETSGHLWTTLEALPNPLHFGMQELLPRLKTQIG